MSVSARLPQSVGGLPKGLVSLLFLRVESVKETRILLTLPQTRPTHLLLGTPGLRKCHRPTGISRSSWPYPHNAPLLACTLGALPAAWRASSWRQPVSMRRKTGHLQHTTVTILNSAVSHTWTLMRDYILNVLSISTHTHMHACTWQFREAK